ncbi:WecB/TagA/CpsF family glycosyltransferase [Patescibacteria group bacterium]|nr:WecB/TagA/CpsF family glycosyltransferase [Patescibacteria group bacterium]MBU1663156.1 WecB/TagA/CpsF family glycosyltransferase [Patescibacteria group bacterium]MBU1934088.1 WecB/TagA/CpsF family glycosyltransferase [Patescibacteria group bacterium]MBU2008105.1 WecB/TagA/CpsF family glycosyltransferase [Patescibacteria group bacterium]MBU2233400.1 WecB/TagA/CpsF family glycosyltransferase [Patescibacteria group bacterium]
MRLINILGVKINIFTKKQALIEIEKLIAGKGQHYLITANPEFILTAIEHDEEFFYILNKADLSLPDGIGLKIAAWFMGKNLSRIAGADLVKNILELAEKQGRKVTIFNWQNGLSSEQDIKQILANQYSRLQAIVINIDRQTIMPDDKLELARKFQPEIIFCTLGAPWQEKFIYHNLSKLLSVKLAIGVGGSFDFLTGKIKRAPKLFRVIGLEWLWRLLALSLKYAFQKNRAEYFLQHRLRRIYNAVIVFPIKFFLWRFILPFLYRPNVVCLLYKKENPPTIKNTIPLPPLSRGQLNPPASPYQGGGSIPPTSLIRGKYKILIVERKNNKNHWQLPQGGTDHEPLLKAGARELREEIGIDKFKPVAVFSNLHQFIFNEQMGKYGVLAKYQSGYKGQKQGLFIAEFLGQDQDIKINFWEHSAWRWVDSDDLVDQVHPIRKLSAKIFLEKFKQVIE